MKKYRVMVSVGIIGLLLSGCSGTKDHKADIEKGFSEIWTESGATSFFGADNSSTSDTLVIIGNDTPYTADLTPQGAEEYLQGRWQFDREAEDYGYWDGMPEGDVFFASFSVKTLIVTFVEGGKVQSYTTDVGSILIDPEGIIEIRQDKKKHTSPPDWIFQQIDANNMTIGAYNFDAPMRRMTLEEVIPSESGYPTQIKKESANQALQPTVKTPVEAGNEQGTAVKL
jgi:hypothetical protein